MRYFSPSLFLAFTVILTTTHCGSDSQDSKTTSSENYTDPSFRPEILKKILGDGSSSTTHYLTILCQNKSSGTTGTPEQGSLVLSIVKDFTSQEDRLVSDYFRYFTYYFDETKLFTLEQFSSDLKTSKKLASNLLCEFKIDKQFVLFGADKLTAVHCKTSKEHQDFVDEVSFSKNQGAENFNVQALRYSVFDPGYPPQYVKHDITEVSANNMNCSMKSK